MTRRILHVDMDEFFAAVEKLDDESLRGRCLLIGGDPARRGVVSTASYEARKFGCRSAMPMATAVRLCPQAVVLPVRMDRYQQVSDRVFEVLGRYSPLVEPVSIDEAFLDVTGCQRLLGPAGRIARAIKGDIRGELGLTASVGVAPNKFLAKLASDLEKPDGLVVLTEETFQQVLDPLGVRTLWGVGPAAERRLHELGIRTIAQVRRADSRLLTDALGQWGEELRRLAAGQDDRPVTPDWQARSISQEETFAEDIGDVGLLGDVLDGQAEQVARRLRAAGLKARTVTLKLRYGDFRTITRSGTLAEATDLTEDIRGKARQLLAAWAKAGGGALRLLGVGVSGLSGGGGRQLPLFDDPRRGKLRRLDRALDDIAERFGPDAVSRPRDVSSGPGR